jgi:hypothetical protein
MFCDSLTDVQCTITEIDTWSTADTEEIEA